HDEVGQVFQAMSPYAFEYLITECLKGQGNQIRKLRRVSGDGGIDGMVMLNKRWHIIQAKRYANPVSAGIVQEFLQLCIEKRMPGVFVASSGFTAPARRLADRQARLTLWDGVSLVRRIQS